MLSIFFTLLALLNHLGSDALVPRNSAVENDLRMLTLELESDEVKIDPEDSSDKKAVLEESFILDRGAPGSGCGRDNDCQALVCYQGICLDRESKGDGQFCVHSAECGKGSLCQKRSSKMDFIFNDKEILPGYLRKYCTYTGETGMNDATEINSI